MGCCYFWRGLIFQWKGKVGAVKEKDLSHWPEGPGSRHDWGLSPSKLNPGKWRREVYLTHYGGGGCCRIGHGIATCSIWRGLIW